jgi:hypothetical protein
LPFFSASPFTLQNTSRQPSFFFARVTLNKTRDHLPSRFHNFSNTLPPIFCHLLIKLILGDILSTSVSVLWNGLPTGLNFLRHHICHQTLWNCVGYVRHTSYTPTPYSNLNKTDFLGQKFPTNSPSLNKNSPSSVKLHPLLPWNPFPPRLLLTLFNPFFL